MSDRDDILRAMTEPNSWGHYTPETATQMLDAYRAKVLAEAADRAESLRQFEPAFGARKSAQISENVGILRVVDDLRRAATEEATS
ncbi:hypothetical protein [Streptomyces sp. PA03-2a]|uniref:hypothetical protein n=1 Tax=Streptomyces sp. PA03-2a TaxID=3028701 RepID=UPI0029BBD6E3|nr:hypothetical protein [Streptomyces sp. PA03-2a]MDX2732822.1 hypothetical protein [Streptomyces sp. PA03-2a]